MIDFFITLDYELYNGQQCGTIHNCLITPTEELLKVLDKYDVKAVFFVDVCFLLRLRDQILQNPELQEDYNIVIYQIKKLSDNGHDIELHIHPNWKRATYNNGQWLSVMEDYKLSDLPEEEAESLFRDGIELLKDITGKDVIAFRAGAYCLQTYKYYTQIFKKYGIKIDSSVNRYRSAKTKQWEWFDYTSIPKKYRYCFSSDICIEDNDGFFTEYSIPNYRITKFDLIRRKKLLRNEPISCVTWGDGKASFGGALYKGLKKNLIKVYNLLLPYYSPLSIDGTNAFYLEELFKTEQKRGEYIMIMGHPKCLTPYSLKTFDVFLNKYNSVLNNMIFR